jgi:hypothetical protein
MNPRHALESPVTFKLSDLHLLLEACRLNGDEVIIHHEAGVTMDQKVSIIDGFLD